MHEELFFTATVARNEDLVKASKSLYKFPKHLNDPSICTDINIFEKPSLCFIHSYILNNTEFYEKYLKTKNRENCCEGNEHKNYNEYIGQKEHRNSDSQVELSYKTAEQNKSNEYIGQKEHRNNDSQKEPPFKATEHYKNNEGVLQKEHRNSDSQVELSYKTAEQNKSNEYIGQKEHRNNDSQKEPPFKATEHYKNNEGVLQKDLIENNSQKEPYFKATEHYKNNEGVLQKDLIENNSQTVLSFEPLEHCKSNNYKIQPEYNDTDRKTITTVKLEHLKNNTTPGEEIDIVNLEHLKNNKFMYHIQYSDNHSKDKQHIDNKEFMGQCARKYESKCVKQHLMKNSLFNELKEHCANVKEEYSCIKKDDQESILYYDKQLALNSSLHESSPQTNSANEGIGLEHSDTGFFMKKEGLHKQSVLFKENSLSEPEGNTSSKECSNFCSDNIRGNDCLWNNPYSYSKEWRNGYIDRAVCDEQISTCNLSSTKESIKMSVGTDKANEQADECNIHSKNYKEGGIIRQLIKSRNSQLACNSCPGNTEMLSVSCDKTLSGVKEGNLFISNREHIKKDSHTCSAPESIIKASVNDDGVLQQSIVEHDISSNIEAPINEQELVCSQCKMFITNLYDQKHNCSKRKAIGLKYIEKTLDNLTITDTRSTAQDQPTIINIDTDQRGDTLGIYNSQIESKVFFMNSSLYGKYSYCDTKLQYYPYEEIGRGEIFQKCKEDYSSTYKAQELNRSLYNDKGVRKCFWEDKDTLIKKENKYLYNDKVATKPADNDKDLNNTGYKGNNLDRYLYKTNNNPYTKSLYVNKEQKAPLYCYKGLNKERNTYIFPYKEKNNSLYYDTEHNKTSYCDMVLKKEQNYQISYNMELNKEHNDNTKVLKFKYGYESLSTTTEKNTEELESSSATRDTLSTPYTNEYEICVDNTYDKRTTCMIRNIPNNYSITVLEKFINQSHFGKYDFLYLRMDFEHRCNAGYAFVNFKDPEDVVSFYVRIEGKSWPSGLSKKIAKLAYAKIQGFDTLVKKFKYSRIHDQESIFRPKVFHTSGPDAGKERPWEDFRTVKIEYPFSQEL